MITMRCEIRFSLRKLLDERVFYLLSKMKFAVDDFTFYFYFDMNEYKKRVL